MRHTVKCGNCAEPIRTTGDHAEDHAAFMEHMAECSRRPNEAEQKNYRAEHLAGVPSPADFSARRAKQNGRRAKVQKIA